MRLFTTLSNIDASLAQVVNQNAIHTREIEELRHTSVVQGDCLKMLDRQVQQLAIDSRKFTEFINNNQLGNQQIGQHQDYNVDQIAAELQERLNRSLNIILFNIQDHNDAERDLNLVKEIPREILNSIGVNTINIRVRRIG